MKSMMRISSKFGLSCEKKTRMYESQHTIWLHLCVCRFSVFFVLWHIKIYGWLWCHAMGCAAMRYVCVCLFIFGLYRGTLKKARNVCVNTLFCFIFPWIRIILITVIIRFIFILVAAVRNFALNKSIERERAHMKRNVKMFMHLAQKCETCVSLLDSKK